MRRTQLTHFTATSIPHLRIDALSFGAPVCSYRKHGRTVYQFRPGQIFGVVWWRHCADDRQHRAAAIVQALASKKVGRHMPGIHEAVAVHAIVDQHGPAGQDGAVDLLLDLIQDLKHRGQKPEQLPLAYWAVASIRILLGPPQNSDGKEIPCRRLMKSVLPEHSQRSLRGRRWLQIAGALTVLWAILPSVFGHRVVVINTSPSVQTGIYIRSNAAPKVGSLIDFEIPAAARP